MMGRMPVGLMVGLILAGSTVLSDARAAERNTAQDEGSRPRSARSAEPPIVDVGEETATHAEIDSVPVTFQTLTCARLTADGLLVAGDSEAGTIRFLNPDGKVLKTLKPGFGPEALDMAADGSLYCGGAGRVVHLDADGRVLHETKMPSDAEVAEASRRYRGRQVRLSGIAVMKDSVCVAFGSGWSLGSKSKLYRFDRDLTNPKLLAEGLRGCCQRCDIATCDGVLYLAENAAHRVVRYDGDGNVLSKWGERSRTELAGFGSCCNPMNLAFDAQGTLYTAESGLGRVKRYTTDGQYLGLVGYVGVERFTRAGHLAASCSNIGIAVTPDGDRVYVIDIKTNVIRVLQRKG